MSVGSIIGMIVATPEEAKPIIEEMYMRKTSDKF